MQISCRIASGTSLADRRVMLRDHAYVLDLPGRPAPVEVAYHAEAARRLRLLVPETRDSELALHGPGLLQSGMLAWSGEERVADHLEAPGKIGICQQIAEEVQARQRHLDLEARA